MEVIDVMDKRAARRWTSSSVFIFLDVCGSRAAQLYSSWGLNKVLYAFDFDSLEQIDRFLRKNESVLLPCWWSYLRGHSPQVIREVNPKVRVVC